MRRFRTEKRNGVLRLRQNRVGP